MPLVPTPRRHPFLRAYASAFLASVAVALLGGCQPTSATKPDFQIIAQAPDPATPGQTTVVHVLIARLHGFDGAVTVTDDVPDIDNGAVSFDDLVIPAGENSADITLTIGPNARLGTQ